jgi:hypothetical protein
MKQELIMWAVIDSVAQEVVISKAGRPHFYSRRSDARFFCGYEKYYGNTAARVRRVKVTIEEAE